MDFSTSQYALQKILKWSVRSSKHEVQSYDRSEGIFHIMALNRGPIDPDILYDQNIHRSETVWDDRNTPEINCRRREAVVQQRWRPETHTFHMPVGECTITLQDVEVLVGLSADGEPVIDQMHDDWGQRLSLTWLGAEFHELANDADEETITRYARAYILQLMGGSIFADKSTRYVHLMFLPFLANLHHTGRYSWGGACLAWLYRQLCKASKQGVREIAGSLILLQIWAWERFPIVAPQLLHVNANQLHGRAYGSRWRDQFCVTRSATHVVSQYRYMFDLLQPSQIV
ncbi:serine/threonine-protein phosphatase 7 long form homolog [Cucumis melo]|uniref:Serine/threonine-protein phosphatase 7 long form homolog n=1 Tax=Cucumis melo TaxID=3656 RepID=A0ABM3L576_CUCME|nr:serine/threonine-protein phosphatase 7 long form homolog [Cucumis melo]